MSLFPLIKVKVKFDSVILMYLYIYFQLLYPKKVKEYRKCIKALRRIGRDCIMRRIERIKSGEEMPNDILTYMLSSKKTIVSPNCHYTI